MSTQVRVAADAPYEVTIGRGLGDRLGATLGGAARVAILHAPELAASAASAAGDLDAQVTLIATPRGEAAKRASVLTQVWETLAEAGFTRSDAVVGLGGGATTDLAGFVAASWLRGVRYVSVPTTLLAMVDAAVGGKTGINLPQGKNLVGSFWEPTAVLCDLDHLATLPRDDLRGGLAEMIKHGFIADERTLELFEGAPAAMLDPASAALEEAVIRSVQVKARVVSGDLRETTSVGTRVGRELLNYGHTFGHAVERREEYRWRHGYAVSVGLCYAALLSQRLGHADGDFVDRHRAILSSVGLPISYAADAWESLRPTMSIDKKARGGSLRFMLLDAVASPFIAVSPDEELLRLAYHDLTG
ncbi:MAG: 3-dehydroquinate synthase [Propioniciclava sp.]